jgi:NDP-sugar pyrophosphorylase family protein
MEFISRGMRLDIPDLFRELQAAGQETSVFPVREHWLDIGRMEDFNRANAALDGDEW